MRLVFSLFFLSVLCGTLWGAAVAQATVDQNTIAAGGTIKLYLQVIDENGDNAEMSLPTLPKDFPFQILRSNGPSTSTQSYFSFTNGKRQHSLTRTSTMVFLLKATKAGSYQIPAIAITYGKNTLQTKPIPIRVLDASQQNASRQRSEDSQNTPPQTVIFRQYLSSDSTVMGASVYLTFELMAPQQMDLRRITPDIPLETLQQDFRIDGEVREEWDQKSVIQDGIRYLIVTKNLRLTPKHPGSFTIPSSCMNYYTVDHDRRKRSRGGFFDDPFFDDPFDSIFGGGSLKENTAASDEIILTVEDFPEEGRPGNYSGLIGPLAVQVQADLTEVYVGDPITLTITLRGNNLNEDDRLPDLKAELEINGQFRLSGDDPAHLNENGEWECTRTLRALSPKVSAIPALKIPYYDLTAKKYDFTATTPIPLNVQEAKKITLQDAHVAVAAAPTPLPEQPETQLTALSGVSAGADWLEVRQNTWSPLPAPGGRKGLLLWILIPAGAWLLIFAGIAMKRKSVKRSAMEIAARGAKAALKHALNQIDDQAGDAGRRLGEALQTFLAARFGFSGAVTVHDLQNALQNEGFSETVSTPLQDILSQCEAAQYGGAAISATELKSRIREAVKPL